MYSNQPSWFMWNVDISQWCILTQSASFNQCSWLSRSLNLTCLLDANIRSFSSIWFPKIQHQHPHDLLQLRSHWVCEHVCVCHCFTATSDDFGHTNCFSIHTVVGDRKWSHFFVFVCWSVCTRVCVCTWAPLGSDTVMANSTRPLGQAFQEQKCLDDIISQLPPSGKCYQL